MRTIKWATLIFLSLAIIVCLNETGQARWKDAPEEEARDLAKTAADPPNTTLAVHNVGNLLLSVTNYGFFGSQGGEEIDPKTGQIAPGAEFPAGSHIDYLFQGALWISALVGFDTLTSTGHDGWQAMAEMYPETFDNGGVITERSNRPGSEFYSPDAVSEQDFIAIYMDTLTDASLVSADPFSGPHIPLGIKITQKSYSWSYSYAQDFVLLDFTLENIREDTLRSLYMGIYIDADVFHYSRRSTIGSSFDDDICGFRSTVPSPSGARACGESGVMQDTINIAWIGDNNGDPVGGVFDYRSPMAVTGTRVVRSPRSTDSAVTCGPTPLDYSFNWWISNGDTRFDWSPQRKGTPGALNASGGLGTPDGDPHKYRYMSNGEFDYDQIYAATDLSDEGWMPPSQYASNLADGYDTRYLLSFGPFEIPPPNPDSTNSIPVTIAYIAGDQFHTNPDNVRNLPGNPDEFYKNLDFTDLAVNAQWAAWVFDNPGFDSPEFEFDDELDSMVAIYDGCRGLYTLANCVDDTACLGCDTIWYAGDGIPDFQGPPPPQAPQLLITTLPGKVVLTWSGQNTELSPDPFSFLRDFEGYRVYMADLEIVSNFALIASWDKVDYRPFLEDETQEVGSPKRWAYKDHPLTIEELTEMFAADSNWTKPEDYPSMLNPYTDTSGQRYYFEAEDWNRPNSYSDDPYETFNKIQRDSVLEYVDEVTGDTAYYGWYSFTIDGLLASQPYFFAVTAFDFGFPQNGLLPLESSPLANSELIYPLYSANVVETEKLEVSVYPNPYKISDAYRDNQYEDRFREAWSERDRRIHFVNLPSVATIKIYTLDGDLVRVIDHYAGGTNSDTDSKARWDLLSKNTQAIVSGIYLYVVESALETQVGKIVIIK